MYNIKKRSVIYSAYLQINVQYVPTIHTVMEDAQSCGNTIRFQKFRANKTAEKATNIRQLLSNRHGRLISSF